MWFVDIVVPKVFKQRFKAISQAQTRRSCLILEASAAARGVLPKAQKTTISLHDWSVCIHLMILNQSSSERLDGLSIMHWQCVHLELNVNGGAEHLIRKWKQC